MTVAMMSNLGSERPELGSGRPDLGSARPDLGSESLVLRLGWTLTSDRKNCLVWNHWSSAPPGPLPKKGTN